MKSYSKNIRCKFCSSKNIKKYLDLNKQPLANSFIKKNEIQNEKKYPLELLVCLDCGLNFLSITINPNIMFKEYDYLSSSSVALKKHYSKLTKDLSKKFYLKSSEYIIDIGCNDGIILNTYDKKYKNLIGIEPSNAINKIKNKNIFKINDFFNNQTLKIIKKYTDSPRIITITNVFAHIDKINNFTYNLSKLSNDNTIIVIEFPYLVDMINKNLYDLIYHEHLYYLSITPLRKFLKKFELNIFDIKKFFIGASGPCLRVYISKNKKIKIKDIVAKYLKNESIWGIKKISTYNKFQINVNSHKNKLEKLLNKLIAENNKIGCFSAPAKGNTLLNFINLNNQIKIVSENNKRKIGKVSPGKHLKVVSDNDFIKNDIDYALLLSWNYLNFFIKKSKFISKGKGFIIPFPKIKIIYF